MHSFARRLHKTSDETTANPTLKTKGLILDLGWRYDLMVWSADTLMMRGQISEMLKKTIDLAAIQPGERALDVGCGTGALAIAAARRVGASGRVVGIDPGAQQIAYASAKAARRRSPAEFQLGVIERLPFPDQSFDVVLSTLMFHHMGAALKRQGLSEIARVLKPGGRLIIADFIAKSERQGWAKRFHAGGTDIDSLIGLVNDAGFSHVHTEASSPRRFSAFPGSGFLVARKE